MISLRSTTAAAFALTFALSFTGPLSADEPTPSINGTVTFQGAPVDGGKIVFHLADDEFVGGNIRAGRYKFTRVPTGKWRVSIEAKGMPAKFASEESPFTVQVKAGKNTFDFDVK